MLSVCRDKSPAEKLKAREKFETLVLALTVDASTIIDRVERQKGRLLAMEDSIATEVAKLLDLLDEVKGQNQDPFVANRIIVCIEQVSVVMNVASKTVMTAMKTGSLQQEQNFIHSMCTLINYVSDVQRDLDSVTSQLSGLSKSSKSQSCNLFEIPDILLFEDRNKDYNGTGYVKTTALDEGQSPYGRFLIERCYRMFKSSAFCIFYQLCAATIFIYVITLIVVTCLGDEDLCSPFINVNYGHGPRPV
ncbi:uncharacterized protein LOC108739549 isoform X1 [Agrilus planipennis]|uniref:Uncharacterized protein LOC108739549 isoform X1 n=1 Tax=Agrilus planipennis TaxID=224129 RepID=A0A1W4X9I1_AGRPL|nr:uncharacterized protein LOC108739549 isoform X1 [Agrilus planipennis]